MDEKIDIILSRYFNGEAADSELKKLDLWLAESEDNENYFMQMTLLYQKISNYPELKDTEITGDLNDFKSYIRRKSNNKENIFKIPKFYYSIAAVIIILLAGIAVVFNLNKSTKFTGYASTDIPEKIFLDKNIEVILDSDTKLESRNIENTEVVLVGKATFIINNSENEEKDFIVYAGETYVKDIGTIFTITAYPTEEAIIVEVEEGEVLFYTANDSGIVVGKGEKGIYNTKNKDFVTEISKDILDDIVFRGNELGEIIKTLEKWYDVNIILKPEYLEQKKIYVSFDKNESIDNIIKIISETLSVKVLKDGNTFIISE